MNGAITSEIAQLRHDIRNQLNIVCGYSEMLLEDSGMDWAPNLARDLKAIRLGSTSKASRKVVNAVWPRHAPDR